MSAARTGKRHHCILAALISLAVPVTARAVMIDDFSTTQTTAVFSPGTTASGQASGAGILGGERDMTVTRVSGVGVTMIASTGALSYGHTGSSEAMGLIVWDGPDASIVLDPTGLGGADFTDGGLSDVVAVSLSFNDFSTPIIFTAYTDAANFSTATVLSPGNIPPDPATVLTVAFADFVTAGGAGADFSNIGAFSLLIDGSAISALDLEILSVETNAAASVPEPSTALLVGGGIVVLGRLRRRRLRWEARGPGR